MREVVFIALLLASSLALRAQNDPEYLMEIGAGVGMVSYQGDFNDNILKGMQPMGGIVLRRNINPHMALRLTGSFGKLKGNSRAVGTFFPGYQTVPYEFHRSLADVGLVYEYNFWPYGTGRDYRGAKRFSPVVFGGLGATYVSGGDKNVFTANVPLGLGVRYKVGERLNLGVDWAVHFSLSDRLDGVEDPYYVRSKGVFKNTDCYSALQVTLTYSFMAKCQTCNNED